MNEDMRRALPDEVEMAGRLERRLASALAPDPLRLQRARAAVLASYQASFEPAARRPARPLVRGWAMAAAFAAMLVGGAGLVAAESGPGEPFYGVRLAIGSLLLPVEAAARDRGLATELDDRLAEARVASRDGDAAALTAALQAYRRTLSELSNGGISDPSVIDALQRHQDVLQGLINTAPGNAQDGLQQALHEAQLAADATPKAIPSPAPPATPPGNPHESGPPSHRP